MAKLLKLTDEMARTHLARLQVTMFAHTAALRRVIDALEADKHKAAIRELGRTVRHLEETLYKNAKERGYKGAKSIGVKRCK